jgi:quaternary ammonium compound-resistance protein SugE
VAWALLLLAGVAEIGFAICMKLAKGFSEWLPSLGVLVFGGTSLALLTFAVRSLPIGTSYAIWTGIGAAGTAAVGMLALGESADATKLVFMAIAIGGAVGLGLSH